MITCDFEKRGNNTLCESVYQTIKQAILSEELKPNEKLPSKRALATHLGVSVITVANAYGQLIDEGYIYSAERRGFYVTDLADFTVRVSSRKSLDVEKNQQENGSFNVKTPVNKPNNQNLTKNIIADFNSNSTGYEKFPFSLWSHILRDVLNKPHEALLKSVPAKGIFELRSEIAAYLKRFRNVSVEPEQIVVGAGTEYLYNLVVQLLGRKQLYAVENPGYNKTSKIITLNGASCIPVPIDIYGLSIEKLKQTTATVAHVSPSHHFPTGIVMPVRRRQELLAWAEDAPAGTKRYIIEDDYDSEFRFNGKPLPLLFNTDGNQSVIHINTFSKTLSPSFRISYMVLPHDLLPVFEEKFSFCSCTVSVFEQYALAAFMKNGYYEKHLIRMKNYYRNLRNSLILALNKSPLASCTEIHEENAGLHFLLSFKTEIDGKEIKKRLLQNGIIAPMLSEYFDKSNDESFSSDFPDKDKTFVINYSGIKKEAVSEIIDKMSDVILK